MKKIKREGKAEYINEIDYRGNEVKYEEEKVIKGAVVRATFRWLTIFF